MTINSKAIIFFQLESPQKQTLFKKIIVYLLFTLTTLFPTKGSPFDNPLAKKSSGVNSPHILKSDNFSLNARNVKVLMSQNNSLWMGTSMGIIKYDTSSVENYAIYDNRNSLLSNGVFSITIGPKKQIWAGTYGGGISVMSKNGWTNINICGIDDCVVISTRKIKHKHKHIKNLSVLENELSIELLELRKKYLEYIFRIFKYKIIIIRIS